MARIRTTPGTPPFYRRLTDGTRRMIGTEWQEIDDDLISAGMRRRQELEIVEYESRVEYTPNPEESSVPIEIQTPEEQVELRDEPQTEAQPEPVDEPEPKAKPKKMADLRRGRPSRG